MPSLAATVTCQYGKNRICVVREVAREGRHGPVPGRPVLTLLQHTVEKYLSVYVDIYRFSKVVDVSARVYRHILYGFHVTFEDISQRPPTYMVILA